MINLKIQLNLTGYFQTEWRETTRYSTFPAYHRALTHILLLHIILNQATFSSTYSARKSIIPAYSHIHLPYISCITGESSLRSRLLLFKNTLSHAELSWAKLSPVSAVVVVVVVAYTSCELWGLLQWRRNLKTQQTVVINTKCSK